jgi:hypothetical protein
MSIAIIDDEIVTCGIANRFGACTCAQVHHSRRYVAGEPKYPSQFLHTHISTEPTSTSHDFFSSDLSSTCYIRQFQSLLKSMKSMSTSGKKKRVK